jgi:hypothetical protein
MTPNKFVPLLSALAAFAVIAAITFHGYGLHRAPPPMTTVQR